MSNAAVLAAGLASIVLDSSRRVATVPVGDLKHPPNWVRQDIGSQEELMALARSYLARPINLILISPDGFIRDGNRRVSAILEDTGPTTPVMVCITDEEITPAVMLEIQIESAEHTKSLTGYEQFIGYSEWLKLTGKSAKELAEKIHRDASQVSRIFSLAKCIPEVHEAAKNGSLSVSDWHKLSQLPASDQPGLLALKLSGQVTSRDGMDRQARRRKASDTPVVRTSKIRVPLVSGATVTVAAEGVSMDEALEAVLEAAKQLKAAISKGITAKSAMGYWKDVAAAG